LSDKDYDDLISALMKEMGLEDEIKKDAIRGILDKYCKKRGILGIIISSLDGFTVSSCGEIFSKVENIDTLSSPLSVTLATSMNMFMRYWKQETKYIIVVGAKFIMMSTPLFENYLVSFFFEKNVNMKEICKLMSNLANEIKPHLVEG